MVRVGDEQVTLDGSGQSQIMRPNGPKISTVDVTATVGGNAFDPGALQFQIVPL